MLKAAFPDTCTAHSRCQTSIGKPILQPESASPRLKILVQDKSTKFFFVDRNIWTKDPDVAHDFHYIHRAVDFCAYHSMTTALVVILSACGAFTTNFPPL